VFYCFCYCCCGRAFAGRGGGSDGRLRGIGLRLVPGRKVLVWCFGSLGGLGERGWEGDVLQHLDR
jgi:hypothetical protein